MVNVGNNRNIAEFHRFSFEGRRAQRRRTKGFLWRAHTAFFALAKEHEASQQLQNVCTEASEFKGSHRKLRFLFKKICSLRPGLRRFFFGCDFFAAPADLELNLNLALCH